MNRTALSLAILLALVSPASSADDAALRAQREDLQIVRSGYVMKSRSFDDEGRRRALDEIEGLEKQPTALSNEQFLLSMLRIAALARNAHDSVHPGWVPPARLPLRMIWFPDGLVVARASPELVDVTGARVERIEGLTPRELQARLRPYEGGTYAFLRWNRLWVIENAGLLHAMGIAKRADRLTFDLALPDGRRVTREIAFVPRAQTPADLDAVRPWSAEPTKDEQRLGWRGANAIESEPLYLQHGNDPFRVLRIPDTDALYVQFRSNMSTDGGPPIEDFVKRVADAIEREAPRDLVLDLRFDVGGDIDTTRDFLRDMARQVKGRILVLIGPYTFSAGIVAAAAVRHDAGKRAILIGDHVGDRLQFWSEAERACLPNARHCLSASLGMWDLVDGCAGKPGCYGDRLDARVDSLEPQARAPLTADDWLARRDPGMEAALQELRMTRTNKGDEIAAKCE